MRLVTVSSVLGLPSRHSVFYETGMALLLLFTPALRAQEDPGEAMEKEIKKVVDVFVTLDREGADPVSADQALYQGAIPGMLRALDPHSIFFDPDQYEQMNQMQRS